MKQIVIENLSFKYEKDNVLENINLKINEKDFIGIVGPNGGGKTTLLKLILGTLKPTTGKIKVNRLRMSYVPQQLMFDKELPITAGDVVRMGRLRKINLFNPFYNKEDELKTKMALSVLNISDLSNKRFGELSGGQRQRVLIARAMVSHPEVLLLDEPTANVDKESQEQIFKLLADYNKHHTVVMVSHDYDFITASVSKVICVHKTLKIHPTHNVSCEHVDKIGSNLAVIDHTDECKEDN